MSSRDEKLLAVQRAVDFAKIKADQLDAIESVRPLTKEQEYEKYKTLNCIERGEKILKENPPTTEGDK